MASFLTFHVPPEGEPQRIIPLLKEMDSSGTRFPTVAALLAFAHAHRLGRRTETHILASTAGLLHKDDEGQIGLTPTAKAIVQLKPEVQADIIHFLLYTGWKSDNPAENTMLWSYKQVVDKLWEKRTVRLTEFAVAAVEEIRNLTQDCFADNPKYDPNGVSFSPKSIRGIRKWLEALVPPVIESDRFDRRFFCAPELMLMAAGWVAQATGGAEGIDFLLTAERREALCRLCILDPAALDNILDWTLPAYPSVILPGTSAGVYGRFLRFLRWPFFEDLLR
jgi:hypothetical protein